MNLRLHSDYSHGTLSLLASRNDYHQGRLPLSKDVNDFSIDSPIAFVYDISKPRIICSSDLNDSEIEAANRLIAIPGSFQLGNLADKLMNVGKGRYEKNRLNHHLPENVNHPVEIEFADKFLYL